MKLVEALAFAKEALIRAGVPSPDADAHWLFDQRRVDPRRGDHHIDSPRTVEHPLILRMIDPSYDPRNTVFRLCKECSDEIDLVISGRGDEDMTGIEASGIEGRDLA